MIGNGFIIFVILSELPLSAVLAVCGEPSTITDGSITGSGYNHGDTRTYSCEPGYVMYGCSLSICKSDDTWSSTPTCGRRNCYSPSYVWNSYRSGNGTRLYDYQRYTCVTGYEITGEDIIYCGVSGWDSAPQCNKVDCGNPPDISFGSWIAPYTTYLDNATYSCDHGYNISGSPVATCKETKTWITPPTCIGVSCGTPPSLANGAVQSSTGTRYPNTATYICTSGYDMIGSDTISCQANQNWTSLPICRVRVCGSPPSIQNGNVLFDGNDFGDIANYSCNTGYTLVGSPSIQCLSTANWEAAPTCAVVDCGTIPVVSDSSSTGTTTTYQSSWQYSCNPGFNLYGLDTVTCDSSASWGTPPVCYVPCVVDPIIINSVISGSGTAYLDTRVIQCDIGYGLQGSDTVTCQMNGQWSTLPTCVIVSCGSPGTIQNGYINGTGTDYLETKSIVCDDGYEVIGDTTITCLHTGLWSTIQDCTKKDCGNPSTISHSSFTVSGTLFTDTTLVTCDSGYDLIGGDTITCQADGLWSALPSCERKDCGSAPRVNNTKVEGTGTRYQDTTMYTCEDGYVMNGSSITTCMSDGQWSETPICTRKTCGDIPEVANSTYTTTGSNYEDIVEYSCIEDHSLTWLDVLMCDENGAWSSRPSCQRIECFPPPVVDNGWYEGTGLYVNDNRTYFCNHGYELMGDCVVFCLENRTWSGSPYCVPNICDYPTNFTFDISGSTLNETARAALDEKLKSIRQLLLLNKKLLTKNVLKHVSVYEKRQAPLSIGLAWGVLLGVLFLVFVLIPDIPRMWHDIVHSPFSLFR